MGDLSGITCAELLPAWEWNSPDGLQKRRLSRALVTNSPVKKLLALLREGRENRATHHLHKLRKRKILFDVSGSELIDLV